MGERALGRQPAFNQPVWRVGLYDACIATAAGIAGADRDNDLEPGRNDVQPFGPILADLHHVGATAGADLPRGFDHLFDARQMVGPMAVLNRARSRPLSAISSRTPIDQTCLGAKGRFCPTIRPLLHAGRRGTTIGRVSEGIDFPPTPGPTLSPASPAMNAYHILAYLKLVGRKAAICLRGIDHVAILQSCRSIQRRPGPKSNQALEHGFGGLLRTRCQKRLMPTSLSPQQPSN